MIKNICLIFFISTCALNTSFAQTIEKNPNWFDNFSYVDGYNVAKVNNRIYCSSKNAIFYYDKNEKTTHKVSKINMLSDVDISCMKGNPIDGTLIIGYKNGNIDIINKNDEVKNITDFKNKLINYSKEISDIMFYDGKAFLATSTGILKLDYNTGNFIETYNLGINGSSYAINALTIDENTSTIYAATNEGVYYAQYGYANLSDFSNWSKLSALQNRSCNTICYFQGNLLANTIKNYSNTNSITDSLFVVKNNALNSFPGNFYQITKITSKDDKLVIVNINDVTLYNSELKLLQQTDLKKIDASFCTDALLDDDGTLWISTLNYGLINSKTLSSYKPTSPNADNVSSIDYRNNLLYVSYGTRYTFRNSRISIFQFYDGNWINSLDWSSLDAYKIIAYPDENYHFFVGTLTGIYEGDSWGKINNHFYKNSILSNSLIANEYIGIQSMEFDGNKNLFTTAIEKGYLYCFSNNKEWGIMKYSEFINPILMTIDKNNNLWIAFMPAGKSIVSSLAIINYNNTVTNTTDDEVNIIPFKESSGEMIAENATCAKIDNNDVLWIGTSAGILYYPNASSATSDNSPVIYRNKVEIDGVVDYLLSSESITCIEIDAANRKWVGTNTGVYVISSDGTSVVEHYNTQNSPLPSNTIYSIKIIPEKSLAYIGTQNGLISYKMRIKPASENLDNISVYPNPVETRYEGTITIEGLMDNSTVSISDVSGNLVYRTNSEGGVAFWNGKNLEGNKVASGVYIVVCISEDGLQKNITKIIINK